MTLRRLQWLQLSIGGFMLGTALADMGYRRWQSAGLDLFMLVVLGFTAYVAHKVDGWYEAWHAEHKVRLETCVVNRQMSQLAFERFRDSEGGAFHIRVEDDDKVPKH